MDLPHVYVYEFDDIPFREPGTGNSQAARMIFQGVSSAQIPLISPEDPDDAFDIWRGDIWVNGQQLNGVFEIPFEVKDSVIRVEIHLNCGLTFKATCTSISYFGLSDLSFVERYRA